MKIILRHILQVTTAAALVFAGCEQGQPDYPKRQMPAGLLEDAAQVAAGHAMFRDKCATCHGKPSEGRSERASFFEPPAPDFTDSHYQSVDPAYLFWRIQMGKTVEPYRSQGSVMPSWQTLSEAKIWQLVAYLRSRSA